MKQVMFKNDSGDEPYIVCELDVDVTLEEIVEVCKHYIGDNYDYEDDSVYGNFSVKVSSNTPKFSNLLRRLENE